MKYEDFPLVLFFRLMMKGEDVAQRAIGMKVLPISRVGWKKIREQWEQNHDDDKGEAYLEAKKRVLTETIQYNKIKLLVHWLKKTKKDPKPIFEEIRVRWKDDPIERNKELNKLLKKAETRLGIYKAQLEKLQENEEQDSEIEEKFTIAKLNQSIASLELHGFNIPDYNALTLGKYDSMTAVINNKLEKQRIKEL